MLSILKQIYNNERKNIEYTTNKIAFKFESNRQNVFSMSLYTQFCEKKIINFIIENTNNYFIYNAKLNTNKIIIYLVPFFEFDMIKFIETFIGRIFIFLEFLKIKNQTIKIFVYATSFKKRLPNNKKSLDVGEINSACAFTFPEKCISIYRWEEVNKLIIHELVHYLDLDINVDIDNLLIEKYHINGQCLSRETYAELIGVFFNVMFKSIETNQSFEHLFEIERAFSLCQIYKIFKFFKIKSTNELYKLKSNTNLFTYYIVKGSILANEKILDFFNYLYNKNYPFKFKQEYNNWFGLLALNSINNLNTLNNLQVCETIVEKELRETMRMTIV